MNEAIAEITTRLSEITGADREKLSQVLERPRDSSLGDLALPCFVLAREKKTAPHKIARQIATCFGQTNLIAHARAHGPYVNFTFHRQRFAEVILEKIRQHGQNYGRQNSGQGKNVVIDFSSPNIARRFGIGHLRSTVIGNALYNIYQALGYNCIGVNHLGDWGTQFGMLIAAFKRWGDRQITEGKTPATGAIEHLQELYVRIHELAENDPKVAEEGRLWFRKLEQGHPEASQLWQAFRRASLKEFQRIYQLLGIKFDSYAGEAFYNPMIANTIKLLREKKLLRQSEGAEVVDLEPYGMPPCLIRKKDEATLYATRDLTAAIYRYHTYRFARNIYVVGADQKLHFKQLFKVLELMGFKWAKNCVHVDFGLVRFKGEKMRTRRGHIVLLEDVLEKAVSLSRQIIEQRERTASAEQEQQDKKIVPEVKFTPQEKERISRAVGIGAIIFNDLKNRRIKDVDFDWNQLLRFDGETGPYLQYTHVRLCGIMRTFTRNLGAGKTSADELSTPPALPEMINYQRLSLEEEHQLVLLLASYPQSILRAAERYEPSIISTFLLELAAAFNKYYRYHRIVSEEPELTAARVTLCWCIKHVLASGLKLLGIEPLEKM
jgi:arginyl-tRNA synthetase